MSNYNEKDPNFGMVGADKDSFESWALDKVDLKDLQNFDLIDYIGADEDNNNTTDLEFGRTEEERNFNQKDKIYTTLQYNQNMFSTGPDQYQNDGMRQAQFGEFENQYPDSMGLSNYIGGGAQQVQNGGYASTSSNGLVDSSMIPTTSKSAIPLPIKVEPGYEEEQTIRNVLSRQGQIYDDSGAYSDYEYRSMGSVGSSNMLDGFHPKTKPRKYRIKPPEEKTNPVYKVKREKNNDAVRRSRDKAKRIQLEKDERLAFLEQENNRDKRTIQMLRTTNEKLQRQLQALASSCSCGAAVRI